MSSGKLGLDLTVFGLITAVLTVISYGIAAAQPDNRKALLGGRILYALTAISVLSTFVILASLVYTHQFQYIYVWEHSGKDLTSWFRFSATWGGQEGSFLLWAAWTAVIGFLVFAKAGRYEARVMPFYVSIIAFLCAILIKESPFHLIPAPTHADILAHPDWHYPPVDGKGLLPSLQNYWMTIHPPTIFFGFASLAVPFCYAAAALIWKDYERWTSRVMPYALLSCATLGLGLFMGGYWAYETQGWHGFWAWDPVENASFFPWLAITALVHGLVVQKSRGGMGRTNTFLGLFAFNLFLLGTFITRSGVLSTKDGDLSIHAFANIESTAFWLMVAMMAVYGIGGFGLWIARLSKIPGRKTTGDTLISRDFAFFMAVLLMLISCVIITLGTTRPLFDLWMHHKPVAPKAEFYNKTMLPIAVITALFLGCVPWLAWRKTNPDTFLKKLVIPWFAMLIFGLFMLIWVLGAERDLKTAQTMLIATGDTTPISTQAAWHSDQIRRVAVVSLASLGFLAAFSNVMLAYRVFRTKPLAAGGWLAHVGIGVLMVGVIVSNTYERTVRLNLVEGGGAVDGFGYKFSFEKMTGKAYDFRPSNPDYDKDNTVELRVAPPGVDDGTAPKTGGFDFGESSKTFLIHPRWFVWNIDKAGVNSENDFERMRWPSIEHYLGHDLYVGFASDPQYSMHAVTLKPSENRNVGPYNLFFLKQDVLPGKHISAEVFIKTPDNKILQTNPTIDMSGGQMSNTNQEIPELRDDQGRPSAILLNKIDPATHEATFLVSLPNFAGQWQIPLEVTYKPWINLVWLGVLIAFSGTMLAMVRRALEARKVEDTIPAEEVAGGLEQEEATLSFPGVPVIPESIPVMSASIKSKRSNPRKSST